MANPTLMTKIKADPYAIAYLIDGRAAGGDPGTLTYAQLLLDLAEGPLKQTIKAEVARSNSLDAFNLTGPGKIRMRQITGLNLSAVVPGSTSILWNAAAVMGGVALAVQVTSATQVIVEIRLQHSKDR